MSSSSFSLRPEEGSSLKASEFALSLWASPIDPIDECDNHDDNEDNEEEND